MLQQLVPLLSTWALLLRVPLLVLQRSPEQQLAQLLFLSQSLQRVQQQEPLRTWSQEPLQPAGSPMLQTGLLLLPAPPQPQLMVQLLPQM